MSAERPGKDEIFNAAAELTDTAERAVFLDEACAGDARLRAEVEGLLERDRKAGSFLESPPPGLTIDRPIREQPGDAIGPYKLREKIGEGGMGVVYVAEQKTPVKRRVALKIIKPGMDSQQVIARFEAERQALAIMDHPNIAKVFDAGATESASPYFVMELVNGLPITQYCDEQQLTPRERLELFIPICQAVQHAHQKGIIHRDLKPSNILVALYDGRPVPKVIDFGVAKATGQTLSEKSVYTQFGQVVGTVEYMSPEQAGRNQLDIDTRSDIYSLGVVLYELLAGDTPFDRARLHSAALDEMLRIIREEEPPKPSTKVSTSEALPSIAANRHIEPRKLGASIRGELDWIVMKALEKDRARRYETANEFAGDIQRYLTDTPVHARPPSLAYRMRKFARRNRITLAVASIVSILVLLLAGSIGWIVRDRSSRQEQTARLLEEYLDVGETALDTKRLSDARLAATKAEGVLSRGGVDVGASLEQRVQQLAANLKLIADLENIRLQMASFSQIEGSFAAMGQIPRYSEVFERLGVRPFGMPARKAAEKLHARPPLMRTALTGALDDWLFLHLMKRRSRTVIAVELRKQKWILDVAQALDEDPLRRNIRRAGFDRDVARLKQLLQKTNVRENSVTTLVALARILYRLGDYEASLDLLRRCYREHPSDFWVNEELSLCGILSSRNGQDVLAEAITHGRIALALRPNSGAVYCNLGTALDENGQREDATAAYHKAIELSPSDAKTHHNLGNSLFHMDQLDQAIVAYRKAVEIEPRLAETHANLGLALLKKRRIEEAIRALQNAVHHNPLLDDAYHNLGVAFAQKNDLDSSIEAYRKALDIEPKRGDTHANLARSFHAQHQYPQAIQHFRQAIECGWRRADEYYDLGMALAMNGQVDEAIQAFGDAIELDPNMAKAHYNLGVARKSTGAVDKAIDAFRKAIEIDGRYVSAHFNLGICLARTGDHAGAIEAYRKVIDLQPNHVGALSNLAGLLVSATDTGLRKPAEAVEYARRAAQLDSDSWLQWHALSLVAYRAGRWKESLNARAEKNKRKPIDTEDRLYLAMTHWQLGNKAEARKWYDQAVAELEQNPDLAARLRDVRREAEQTLDIPVPDPSSSSTSDKN